MVPPHIPGTTWECYSLGPGGDDGPEGVMGWMLDADQSRIQICFSRKYFLETKLSHCIKLLGIPSLSIYNIRVAK